MRLKSIWQCVAAITFALGTSVAFADLPLLPGLLSWPMQGGSELNQYHSYSLLINKLTINSLHQTDLSLGLNMGITAVTPSVTPTILGGQLINMMYVSDMNGNLYGFDVTNNKLIWKKNYITYYSTDSKLGGKKIYINYTTPTVVDGLILVGNNYPGGFTPNSYTAIDGAILMAIDRYTGALVWSSQLDPTPVAQITASPVVHNGIAYVGISTYESGTPGFLSGSIPAKNYNCCVFRGNVVAVNVANGNILWKSFLMPTSKTEQKDYTARPTGANSFSGSSVWGGQVAFDAKRNQVIVTTGQTHTLPALYHLNPLPIGTANDALVALDAKTGNINWMHNFGIIPNPADMHNPIRPDAWNESCISPLIPFIFPGTTTDPNAVKEYCRSDLTFPHDYAVNTASMFVAYDAFLAFFQNPSPSNFLTLFNALLAWQNDPIGTESADRDFPQGAMVLYDVKMSDGNKHDLIVSMQKTTVVHAVDANTGVTVWDSPSLGGVGASSGARGSAYDGKYIYAIVFNEGLITLPVKDINGNITTTTGSILSAVDPATGRIVWQRAFPTDPSGTFVRTSHAAMTVVNGMIIVGDDFADVNPIYPYFGIVPHDTGSNLYVFDTNDGHLIKQFTANLPAGTQVAPAVVGDSIYWVTGEYHPEDQTRQTAGQVIKLSIF